MIVSAGALDDGDPQRHVRRADDHQEFNQSLVNRLHRGMSKGYIYSKCDCRQRSYDEKVVVNSMIGGGN